LKGLKFKQKTKSLSFVTPNKKNILSCFVFLVNALGNSRHRCRSRQILGVQRILCQFPQTFPKNFCATNFSLQKLSQKHEDLFRGHTKNFFWRKKVKFRRFLTQSVSLITQIEWKCRSICAWIFRYFARIFDEPKLLRVRFHPQLLHHWLLTSDVGCRVFVYLICTCVTIFHPLGIFDNDKIIRIHIMRRRSAKITIISTLVAFECLW